MSRINFVPEGKFFRIVAMETFNNHGTTIKKGTIGGLVSLPSNIAQSGTCWIDYDAQVHDESLIEDDALVSGNAIVKGKSKIGECALIKGEAIVYNGTVFSSSIIDNSATILGSVSGKSVVKNHAFVGKNASIKNSLISGLVGERVVVENSIIGKNANLIGNIFINKSTIDGVNISNERGLPLFFSNAHILNENEFIALPWLHFLPATSVTFFVNKQNDWEYFYNNISLGGKSVPIKKGLVKDGIKNIFSFSEDNVFSKLFEEKASELLIGETLYHNFLKLMFNKIYPDMKNITEKTKNYYTYNKMRSVKMDILFTMLVLNVAFLYEKSSDWPEKDIKHAEMFLENCNINLSDGSVVDVSNTVICNKKIVDIFFKSITDIDEKTKKHIFKDIKKGKAYIPMQI